MELPYSNLQMKVWNPGASSPLVLPIHVICNTSEDVLIENVSINSRRFDRWFATQPENNQIAVLCGSGPSIADHVEEIRAFASSGAKIIALNGAAAFLYQHGIMPDCQVILDAQPETASLVGPAKAHWFASQCHPDTFDRAPNPGIWHLQFEGIEDHLPRYDHPYALIGAASSVGTTAAVLAFAMGHRTLHCFGYDSSNKGEESHAFHQAMNDGEPMCSVAFNGKHYRCSLTMKLQAERFPMTARLLQREGCKIFVHGHGLLPDIWNAPVETLTEREKYQRMWSLPEYRAVAPGEVDAELFLSWVRPQNAARVLDFGCGTGRGGLTLHAAGLDVTLIDFASNCRDTGAERLPFFEWDLADPMPFTAHYGYCTDVLEHIPPEQVNAVLANMLNCAPTLFLRIDTKPDLCGALINQTLHVCLMHHEEWKLLLEKHADILRAENDGDHSVFLVQRKS